MFKKELNLVEPTRRFVREGNLKVIEKGRTTERNTYVFNDLIVITKPKKSMMGNVAKDQFKAKLMLNEIKIVDVADTGEIKNACDVQPVSDGGKKFSFRFVFNTPEEKVEWVKEIKSLVREFQIKAFKAAKEAKEKQGKKFFFLQ